jgi:anti-sigma factor RsiW
MNCVQYEEQISAYIDHELDDAQTAALFEHLGVCSSCRTFLTITLQLRSTLSAHTTTVPATLDERIDSLGRVGPLRQRSAMAHRAAAWWRHRLAVPAPAFALLVLMLLGGAAAIIGLTQAHPPQIPSQTSSVVYIMSLSPIEVEAQRIHDTPHMQ